MTYWTEDGDSFRSMNVIEDADFQQPVGFVYLKETTMQHELTPKDMLDAATARELAPVKGIIDDQLARMEATTKASVYKAIREGVLTPADALAYWMEMYAYQRLNTRLTQASVITTQGTSTHG